MFSWLKRIAAQAWNAVVVMDKGGAGGAFEYIEQRIVALEARIMRLEATGPAAGVNPHSKRF
jgi:hypothetical protein